jgi:hypothetical protein
MMNRTPPKPVRFAFKVFLYLFPIARGHFLWIICRNFQMRQRQVRVTPLGFPNFRRLPFPHKDKPPARLGLLGGTPRSWIHEPQRGKPLASRIGLASQGADGCRYRSIRESESNTQRFFKTGYQRRKLKTYHQIVTIRRHS